MMRNQLSKAIGLIDTGVNRIKSYSFSGVTSPNDTKKNTVTDKFHLPNHITQINHNLSTNQSTNFNNTQTFTNGNANVNSANNAN